MSGCCGPKAAGRRRGLSWIDPQGAWPGTSSGRTLPSSAGGPQLTSVLGCDPASSQVHWREPRPPTDSMPSGGEPRHRPWPPPPPPHHSAGRLPECWAGQPAPPGSCLQSSSVPRPGDWRTLTPIAASYGQVSPWSLPLLCPQALGWGPAGASVCPRASWPPAGSGARPGRGCGFFFEVQRVVSGVFQSQPCPFYTVLTARGGIVPRGPGYSRRHRGAPPTWPLPGPLSPELSCLHKPLGTWSLSPRLSHCGLRTFWRGGAGRLRGRRSSGRVYTL